LRLSRINISIKNKKERAFYKEKRRK